ncbi:NACHT domain-containing protein [Cupriavidus sp. H39]|uniref:NACHT domain-containing protein n=1 Tax=Cupriavidus sp. H39 TaxID=3401635 RepID=UPI003CFFF78E
MGHELASAIAFITATLHNEYVASFLAIGGALGALSGYPKLASAVKGYIFEHRAARIEAAMTESNSVGAFTRQEIIDAISDYIEPNCSSTDPSDEDDPRNVAVTMSLFDAIESHLQKGGTNRHVIILADSGMGKTTFCLNFYAKKIAENKKNDRVAVTVIPLGRAGALEKIKDIARKRDTILLLDALDEDPAAQKDSLARLRELMEAASDFRHVIITCRSQFFPSDDAIPDRSGIMFAGPRKGGASREYPLHRVFITPFTDEQIDRYVKKHFPLSYRASSDRKDAREMIKNISELSFRPMLLALVPDLVRNNQVIRELFPLYEFMVNNWLIRESSWIREETLSKVSRMLAVDLYCKQQNGKGDRFSQAELDELCVKHDFIVDQWLITQRSLLNRDAAGNYKFAHRSILEFLFVLEALDGNTRCLDVRWTNQMRDFLLSYGRETADFSFGWRLLQLDHTKTDLFPLNDQADNPKALTMPEIKSALDGKRDKKSLFPVQWHLASLRLVKEAGYFTIFDSAFDRVWNFIDYSTIEEPSVYYDSAVKISNELYDEDHVHRHGRLPTLEEVISLCGVLPHCEDALICPQLPYWLGDTLGDRMLVFSVGSQALTDTRFVLLGQHFYPNGYRLYVYHLASRKPQPIVFGREFGDSRPDNKHDEALTCRVRVGGSHS